VTVRGSSDLSLEAARAALDEILGAEPAVLAAYVFGSVARGGVVGPLSDIDVGLLVADGDAARVCDRISDGLCRRLQTSSVDVISLATAAMPLRYRVIRDGVLVLRRDPASFERFFAETVRHYLDFKPVRDRAFGDVRDAILADR
jgi:predicted nucleotidyltransferase